MADVAFRRTGAIVTARRGAAELGWGKCRRTTEPTSPRFARVDTLECSRIECGRDVDAGTLSPADEADSAAKMMPALYRYQCPQSDSNRHLADFKIAAPVFPHVTVGGGFSRTVGIGRVNRLLDRGLRQRVVAGSDTRRRVPCGLRADCKALQTARPDRHPSSVTPSIPSRPTYLIYRADFGTRGPIGC